jgi:hypothetical protein
VNPLLQKKRSFPSLKFKGAIISRLFLLFFHSKISSDKKQPPQLRKEGAQTLKLQSDPGVIIT